MSIPSSPMGKYCYFCDVALTPQDNVMTTTVSEHPRNSLWCHTDCAADREFEDNLAKPRYVVVVWDCEREMGGQEEGGWSFETGERILDADFTNKEAAEKVREGLEIEYPYTGQRGMFSKRGPDYSVVLYDRWSDDVSDEDTFDARLDVVPFYPVVTPHYE